MEIAGTVANLVAKNKVRLILLSHTRYDSLTSSSGVQSLTDPQASSHRGLVAQALLRPQHELLPQPYGRQQIDQRELLRCCRSVWMKSMGGRSKTSISRGGRWTATRIEWCLLGNWYWQIRQQTERVYSRICIKTEKKVILSINVWLLCGCHAQFVATVTKRSTCSLLSLFSVRTEDFLHDRFNCGGGKLIGRGGSYVAKSTASYRKSGSELFTSDQAGAEAADDV